MVAAEAAGAEAAGVEVEEAAVVVGVAAPASA